MDNFDLRKYLAEGRLLKENTNPIWVIDSFEDNADISDVGSEYKTAVINIIKAKHPNISSKDLEKSIEVTNNFWYDEARKNSKVSDPEEIKVSAEDFAGSAIEYYEDIIMYDGDKDEDSSPGYQSFDDYIKGEKEAGNYLAENKLLKEDMSLTMDELEKLANLKSDEFKSSPKKLVDMVMGSVKFNLEKDGTNIENASEDEIDKLRYKWARLKGLLKVKDTFTSMYGKRGVKTNTDKDLLDKIKAEGKLVKENIQDEDLIASQAIDILDEFRVYAESENLIQYLNQSMDYLERIPSNDDVYSAIQAVADGLNPYTGEEFDYEVDDMQSELERLIN